MSAPQSVEHFFRHEYGRLVAVLSCRVGIAFVEDVEDAVQAALVSAMQSWSQGEIPANPSAWLYRSALNQLLGERRKQVGRRRLLKENVSRLANESATDLNSLPEEEVADDLLRMLFVCCDDGIPAKSQLVLALKVLCGFSVRDIALRLFISEANTYKRLTRARAKLREPAGRIIQMEDGRFDERLPAVQKILYLLYTEGYLSVNVDHAIREELCEEALRLATLLAGHPAGKTPDTLALLALMQFHSARSRSRTDGVGGLILLEEQDRKLWDRSLIQTGMCFLAESSVGERFSRYHAEAGIAAEHCLAVRYDETRWDRIIECYEILESTTPSPIHQLNQAVAIAEWKGPKAALEWLSHREIPIWLAESYLWNAVHADLYVRCGGGDRAAHFRELAFKAAPTPAVVNLLKRRLSKRQEEHCRANHDGAVRTQGN